MASLIGQSLGRYRVIEQLGEGGMAVVYKALDTRLGREVAIKLILPGREHSEQFLKRFEREARALAQLSHPNIVKVLDYGEHEGLPYLVMEYIPGGNLKQRLVGKAPYMQAARLLAPVARALAYVHDQKIIHRDVKPANILLTKSGEPMLSDFGIAKLLYSENTTELTGTGMGLGTPVYMAPEQGLGQAVDHRADIYALGVVFYELITGRKPYSGNTPMAVTHYQMTQELPRPSSLVPGLPNSVELVLLKALARDPGKRYQSMHEFAAALDSIGRGQVSMVPELTREQTIRQTPEQSAERTVTYLPQNPPPAARAVPPAQQSRAWLWLGGGALFILGICAVSGIVFAWQYLGAKTAPEPTATLKGQALVVPAVETPLPTMVMAQTSLPGITWTQTPLAPPPTITASQTPIPVVQDNTAPIMLAYVRGSTFENEVARVYVANADGSGEICVACDSYSQTEPSISEDGKNIVYQYAFGGQVDLYIYHMDGHWVNNLTNTSAQSEREPSFSPDGTQIAYRVSPLNVDRNSNGDIFVMKLDTSSTTSLGIQGRSPVWSPDGRKLAYMSKTSGIWQIFVYSFETKTSQKITSNSVDCRWPAWSPDSNFIAYNTTTSAGSNVADSIWYIPAGGSGSAKLVVSSGSPGRPSWSVSGWIAFNSNTGIERIQPDGTQRSALIPGDSTVWAPAWSK